MAYTTLVSGTTITASWANASVRDQVVSPFTDSAARASAITSPVAGMITTLTTTNRVDTYNGTAWCPLVYPSDGALITWTPTLQQGAGVACTNNYSVYWRSGRRYTCQFYITATAAGTGGSPFQIGGLPATPVYAAYNEIGSGHFIDVSDANKSYPFHIVIVTSTSTLQLWTAAQDHSTPALGTTGSPFTNPIASSDVFTGQFWFEATTD